MTISESDFTMKSSSKTSDRFDLTFIKRVKKRDTGKYELEPGDTLYGLTLLSAIRHIAIQRVHKKYNEEEIISLKQFMKDYNENIAELKELCHG